MKRKAIATIAVCMVSIVGCLVTFMVKCRKKVSTIVQSAGKTC